MALLRPLGCDENVAPVALRAGETVYAGRAPECALHVADQAVSRKHAALELTGGKVQLRNLKGAAFPVFVNGTAVEHATLAVGDTVSFQRVDTTFVTFRLEATPLQDATVAVRALRHRGCAACGLARCAALRSRCSD